MRIKKALDWDVGSIEPMVLKREDFPCEAPFGRAYANLPDKISTLYHHHRTDGFIPIQIRKRLLRRRIRPLRGRKIFGVDIETK